MIQKQLFLVEPVQLILHSVIAVLQFLSFFHICFSVALAFVAIRLCMDEEWQ